MIRSLLSWITQKIDAAILDTSGVTLFARTPLAAIEGTELGFRRRINPARPARKAGGGANR